MKRHLFYTFLGIFALTSIVTLLGVIGVVHIADGYLTALVTAFLVELAGAVIAIFRSAEFFADEGRKSELIPKPELSRFPEPAGQPVTIPSVPAVRSSEKDSLEHFRSAHFYWLGSDLMEAIRSVAVYPKKETATQALFQSLRHFRKAGLKDATIEARLEWLININSKKLESEWNNETNRKDILNEILVVRDKISHLVEREAGTEFKPFED